MNSKTKLLSLFAGAVTLSLSAAAIPAFAQSTNSTAPTQHHQKHEMNFLNLTADQQAQMKKIHQNERSQIDNILTADQKAQLQRDRQNHQAHRPENGNTPGTEQKQGMHHSPFASLNLTADQQTKIKAVMQSSKTQMDGILTPEQRQTLQLHQQQHNQHPSGSQSAPAQ